jgi:hypothetical protein
VNSHEPVRVRVNYPPGAAMPSAPLRAAPPADRHYALVVAALTLAVSVISLLDLFLLAGG